MPQSCVAHAVHTPPPSNGLMNEQRNTRVCVTFNGHGDWAQGPEEEKHLWGGERS